MIELKNITKQYQLGSVGVTALNGVSLDIHKGEFVAIMGASGSGKSTLLHILGLLDKPTGGSYVLGGKEISKLQDDELAAIRNKFLGFVFQSFNLLARVSAKENVELPIVYSDTKTNFLNSENLLQKVGLGDRIHHKPNELSGGQQQRVAIARSLINNPLLILADEPTGNLDTKAAAEIIGLLKELNNSGITIVMVTHEPDLAEAANRIIKLQDGNIISDETKKPMAKETGETAQSAQSARSASMAIHVHKAINYMRVKDYFYQAARALFTNKTRSALSILGVLIGVTCLITMMALGRGAQDSVKKQISNLGSNILMVRIEFHRGGVSLGASSPTRFTLKDVDEIKGLPDITKVAPYCSGSGQMVYQNKNTNASITGTTEDYIDIKNSKPVDGRFFTREETISRAKVAVIGKTVQTALFGDQDPIGEFIKIRGIDFFVIGVLPAKGTSGWRDMDNQVVIPINTAMYRIFGKEYVDNMEVQVSDASLMERAQDRIKKLLIILHRLPASRESEIDIRNMAEIQETITNTMKTFSYLLGSIAFVSLLVGGIGIMNIMLVSVTERTREIGLRKAIGANTKDILFQFVIESVAICLLGGLIGILLGAGIAKLFAVVAGWATSITISSIVLAFTFSFLVGFIFGLWPARKASRLNPIDALRYE
ncbi:MAG: MacB family efflux pump subunit [Elusimicrobia bacterium RIFOXYB2_FULL_48_7]|nr:MAG: MacB family efflux pump subunit [Elusimicrobia bacterium RIFOXYB2_FULL_48_7]